MRIQCQKEDLLYGVQNVARAVSAKNTLPVLGGILIVAEEGRLIFRATDLEMSIECVVGGEIEEPGSLVVPGKYFSELVRYLPNCPITLESNGQQLSVHYEQSQVTVNCFDVDEFPTLPPVEGQTVGRVAPAVFRRLVRQTVIAAAADEIRPVFAGILLELTADQLTLVATDTHRLAISRGGWQGSGEASFILPNRTMQEVARLAVGDEELITITAGKNQAFFSLGNITFTSRVVSGQYPEYGQVLPSEKLYNHRAVVNKQRLLEALERAGLFAREAGRSKPNMVRLHWQDDLLTMTADVPDMGRIKEEMPILLEGEGLEAGYNARYLTEALKVMEGERIIMRLTGPTTPGIIMPEENAEDEEYIYLILPIRLS